MKSTQVQEKQNVDNSQKSFFVAPKLTKHGDATKVTASFFGSFSCDGQRGDGHKSGHRSGHSRRS